jgi:hypothetical protein
MLFKESFRQAERYRLRKKLKKMSDSEELSVSTNSISSSSSDGERGSEYLDFEKIKRVQYELDNLTLHINELKADIALLAGSNGNQYEMSFKESIANAYDKERFELSEREFGQPFRK